MITAEQARKNVADAIAEAEKAHQEKMQKRRKDIEFAKELGKASAPAWLDAISDLIVKASKGARYFCEVSIPCVGRNAAVDYKSIYLEALGVELAVLLRAAGFGAEPSFHQDTDETLRIKVSWR